MPPDTQPQSEWISVDVDAAQAERERLLAERAVVNKQLTRVEAALTAVGAKLSTRSGTTGRPSLGPLMLEALHDAQGPIHCRELAAIVRQRYPRDFGGKKGADQTIAATASAHDLMGTVSGYVYLVEWPDTMKVPPPPE